MGAGQVATGSNDNRSLTERFGQEIHEDAGFSRQKAGTWIDRENPALGDGSLGQDRHQTTRLDIVFDREPGKQRDPAATKRRPVQGFGVVGPHDRIDRHFHFAPATRKPPAGVLDKRAEMQTGMFAEIGRFRRAATAFEVIGCGAKKSFIGRQLARHIVAGLQIADPHTDIGAPFDQIDITILEGQFEPDSWVAPHEVRQQRRNTKLAVEIGQRDPQHALGLARQLRDRGIGFLRAAENVAAAIEVKRARLGERDAAGRAVEQTASESALRLGYPPTERRVTETERVGGGEAQPLANRGDRSGRSPCAALLYAGG